MTTPRKRVLLSWSSGKDSAWALHVLRQRPDLEVVGLLTTFNEAFDRVAMHAVRRELVEAQAAAVGLPLVPVMLPYPCTNEREGFWFADLRPAETTCIETEGAVS
jgi:diphthamide synthase (EF-2-diphthine--ammonia ligase)